MANPISRSLVWLQDALGLDTPDAPAALDVASVLPVVDVLQAGWAYARPEVLSLAIPQNTGASNTELVQLDRDEQAVVVAGRIDHAGGGGALSSTLYQTQRTGVNNLLYVARATAVGGSDTWADITGRPDTRLHVLPDWSFWIAHPATGAGETLTYTFVLVRLPAGVRPY